MIKEPSKTIAVDLDQTLCHTLESLVEWHNAKYSTKLTIHDFHTTTEYWKVWGGTREESCAKIREFYKSDHFTQIQPIKDFALEALKMLKKRKFTLVIVTARPQFIARETKKFVDKHYPGIFESIYFCNLNLSEKEQLEYISKPKSVICREIGAHVLIDDSLDHALDCARKIGHMDVLLYDRHGSYIWNHQQQHQQPQYRHDDSQTELKSNEFIRNATKIVSPPSTVSIYGNMNNKKRVNNSRLYYQRTCPTIVTTPSVDAPNNVQRVFSWRDIITQFPKPASPLRHCHYPNEFLLPDLVTSEEEEEMEEEDELLLEEPSNITTSHHQYSHNNANYYGYETVELEELSDEEEEEEDISTCSSPWTEATVWL